MFSLAFEILSDLQLNVFAVPIFVREFAVAAGAHGVYRWPSADILALHSSIAVADVDFIHLHKTADFICSCAEAGRYGSKCDAEQVAALAGYGKKFGLAFQILDDVIDADMATGKKEVSILHVMSRENAIKKAQSMIESASHAIEIFGTAAKLLENITRFAFAKLLITRFFYV